MKKSFLYPFLFLILSIPLAAQEETPPAEEEGSEPAATLEEIDPADAAAQIKDALKSKEEMVMLAAIETMGMIPSKLVTKEVAVGLKAKQESVRKAAIEALRYNTDPSSLTLLLKSKKDKKIQENAQLAEAYALALGQKGDRKAIPALTDGLVANSKTPTTVIKAKLLALGHIRHRDSIEAILDYSQSRAGRRLRGSNVKLGREERGSLQVLTGTDQGERLADWERWWNEHGRKFEVPKEEFELENARDQKAWVKLWMTPEEKEEAERKAKEAREKREKAKKGDGEA